LAEGKSLPFPRHPPRPPEKGDLGLNKRVSIAMVKNPKLAGWFMENPMENPKQKWRRTGGTQVFLGHLHSTNG